MLDRLTCDTKATLLEFKYEVRHSRPNNSFQRTRGRGGPGPLNSKR
jgi:hypothetical protein